MSLEALGLLMELGPGPGVGEGVVSPKPIGCERESSRAFPEGAEKGMTQLFVTDDELRFVGGKLKIKLVNTRLLTGGKRCGDVADSLGKGGANGI